MPAMRSDVEEGEGMRREVEALPPVLISQISQAELPFTPREPAPAPLPIVAQYEAPHEAIYEQRDEAPASAPATPAPVLAPAPRPLEVAPKPAPKFEPVDLEASGLVMIETSRDKAKTEPLTEEAVTIARGPRPKPAWAQQQSASSNEPMQQIETHNDS